MCYVRVRYVKDELFLDCCYSANAWIDCAITTNCVMIVQSQNRLEGC